MAPYAQARPVEPGWDENAWFRAFNTASCQIARKEGTEAARVARESGRVREEARKLKDKYDPETGRQFDYQSNKRNRDAAPSPAPAPSSIAGPSGSASSLDRLSLGQPAPRNAMASALPLTYPLTVSQSKLLVTLYEEDNAKINGELEAVRAVCQEKCKSNTSKCSEHAKEIRRLWRTYYTNPRPGSWASYRSSDYIVEMRKMFDSRVDIQRIHAHSTLEKRMHYKDALCTIRLNDDPDVMKYKQEAAAMYDGNKPEDQIREFLRKNEAKVAGRRSQKQIEYDARLAACESEGEKIAIYKEDVCTPLDSDTPALAKLRAKWKALFEGGMNYPEIFAILQKDIQDHSKRARDLTDRIDGLQRAKAAHNKEAIAKEKAQADKEAATWLKFFRENTYNCSSEGCQNFAVPLSLEDGVLECGLCYQMYLDRLQEHRTYYCTEECVARNNNGRTHLLNEHPCASGPGCTTGPLNRSVQEKYFRHCDDCLQKFNVKSYFCTDECQKKNWGDHCAHRHKQLRLELNELLEGSKEAFDAWAVRVELTDEEIRRITAGYDWNANANRDQNQNQQGARSA